MINTNQLRRAIRTGDVKEVSEMLRAASKEEVQLAWGWTPLHVAVKRGNKAVIAAILETGADINATTEMHQTALNLTVKTATAPLSVTPPGQGIQRLLTGFSTTELTLPAARNINVGSVQRYLAKLAIKHD